MVVARVEGRGKEESLFNGYRASVLQDEKCFMGVDNGDGCTTVQMYLIPVNYTH